jgi:hypothetical protein
MIVHTTLPEKEKIFSSRLPRRRASAGRQNYELMFKINLDNPFYEKYIMNKCA